MKKYIKFLFILLIGINQTYAQIDTAYILSYDSTFNYFVFKPNISITASKLVGQNSTTFKLSKANTLILNRTGNDDLGMKHYIYKQYYNNVKVDDSQFYIHANKNDIPFTANGELSYGLNINTTPTVSSTQAVNLALSYANATQYFWQDTVYENTIKEITGNRDTSYYPNAELVIINLNPSQKDLLPNYLLTYKVPIYSLAPFDSYYLYVDANNGNIVFKKQIMKSCFNNFHIYKSEKKFTSGDSCYENNNKNSCAQPCNQGPANTLYYDWHNIYTDRYYHGTNCTHRLKNTCTETFLYVVKSNGKDYRNGNNLWADADDKPGITALWCLERTHDFYRNTYGRNSFDGNYSQVKLFAEKTWNGKGQNAKWIGTHLEIGDGSGTGPFNNDLTTLDVIGHEFTHGVTDYEANFTYQGESGALDESFSDIFGTMIDFYGKTNYNTGLQPNYILGEECSASGKQRDMSDPNSCSQPDTYGGNYWKNPDCGTPTSDNDYCGVHYNSGVQNFWFYLLAEGGSGTNDLGNQYCVDGIGRDKAAKIAYWALTTYLSPNSQYSDARFWSIQSAKDLYGNNSNEVVQVASAWYAVGVGSVFSGIIEINNHTVSGTEVISYNNEIVFNNFNETPTGNFTVTSNTRITMNTLSKASSGSYFHAYIAPGCNSGAKIQNPEINYETPNILYEKPDSLITNLLKETKFIVSPNPNNGNMNIVYDIPENETGTFEIYDIFGKKLLSYPLYGGKNTFNVSATSLDEGIYFYRATAGNKQIEADKLVIIK